MDLIAKLPAIAAAIYRCEAQGHQAGPRLHAERRMLRLSLRSCQQCSPLAHSSILTALPRSNTYKRGALIEPNPQLDWAANLAHQMGRRQAGVHRSSCYGAAWWSCLDAPALLVGCSSEPNTPVRATAAAVQGTRIWHTVPLRCHSQATTARGRRR